MKRLGVFLLPPGWDASPSQGYPQHKFAGTHGERHCENKVSCSRTQHNVPGQGSNSDRSIRSWAHQPWGHFASPTRTDLNHRRLRVHSLIWNPFKYSAAHVGWHHGVPCKLFVELCKSARPSPTSLSSSTWKSGLENMAENLSSPKGLLTSEVWRKITVW